MKVERFRRFRVTFKDGGLFETGRMGATEEDAVRKLMETMPDIKEILPIDPPDEILCATFIQEYADSNWPFCSRCGQKMVQHPVMETSSDAKMAKQFIEEYPKKHKVVVA